MRIYKKIFTFFLFRRASRISLRQPIHILLTVASLVTCLLYTTKAQATACTIKGNMVNTAGVMLYCNESLVLSAAPATVLGGACTAAQTGNILYTGGKLYFCNGTNYRQISNEAVEAPTSCGTLAVGGFYYDKTSPGGTNAGLYWYCGTAGIKRIP